MSRQIAISRTSDSKILQPVNEDIVFITSEEVKQTTYHVHIDDYIEGLSYFRPLQSIFNGATEDDTIVIHLNSQGGDMMTALTIYNWMAQTDAHTVVIPICAMSSATFFIMAADEVRVLPQSVVMVHSASYDTPFYDQQKVKGLVDFYDSYLSKVSKDIYEGFLSEQEIILMDQHSKEFWMDSEELQRRLIQKNQHFKEIEICT